MRRPVRRKTWRHGKKVFSCGLPTSLTTDYRNQHERGPEVSDFDAVMIAEGVQDATHEEQLLAWQQLIDTGLAWRLQGWFGRTAQALIEQGLCEAKGGA